MDINLILCAVASSVGVGFTQWIKNVTQDGKIEPYELKGLIPSVLSGAVAGLVAQVGGLSPEIRVGVVAVGGLLVQNLAKAGWRHGGKVVGLVKAPGKVFVDDLKAPDAK